jgi:hypothetical protein
MPYNLADKLTDTSGKWFEIHGSRFRIRSATDPEYQKIKEKIERPFKRDKKRDKLSQQEEDNLVRKTVAFGLITDWQNVGDWDDDASFSHDNAYELLQHNDDLVVRVLELAGDQENYRERVKKTAKKSRD